MKKLLAFYLLILHLFAATSLQELAKLPVLVEHYYEHKALDKHITFATYVVDHYNAVPHTDDDQERDDQLPFKSPDNGVSAVNHFAVPNLYQVNLRIPFIPLAKTFAGYSDERIPAPWQLKIWQPPKV